METALIHEMRAAYAALESAIAGGPILPHATPQEIRDYLNSRYDFKIPLALDSVVADVEQMLRKWQVHVTHPRYFGLYNPSVTFASVIGDTLAAMYNPQLATWRTSPGPIEMERHVLAWLTSRFGLPDHSVANFTSGGTEANLSAVTAALTWKFPELGERGLRHLPAQPSIYLTGEAHHSYEKIAHTSWLGRQAVRTVATLPNLKMDLNDLEARVAADRENGFAPLVVVATAGTTAAGIIDPLPEVAAFCRRHEMWFHADAAYGGAAIVSPRLKAALAGIEAADSITCDAHKWFSVPMGAGMFFCRHPEAVADAYRVETPYMPAKTSGQANDPYTTTSQWSRRFIGLKFFLSLAHHGESGYIEMIEHQARMADLLRELLLRDGWRIVNDTPLPVVCFTRDGLDMGKFVDGLHQRQTAWMAATRLRNGEPVARACVTSYRTSADDITEVVAAMKRQLHETASL